MGCADCEHPTDGVEEVLRCGPELLRPKNFGVPIGSFGPSWCLETTGAIDKVERQLQTTDSKESRHLRRREFDRVLAVTAVTVVSPNEDFTSGGCGNTN